MGKLTISVSEAAELLGISRPTMYQLSKREDFPSFRAGGRILISLDGLRKWLEDQIHESKNND